MMNLSDEIKTLSLLPLAITQSGNHEACVAAVTPEGKWIRPEPIFMKDLNQSYSLFKYQHWSSISTRQSSKNDSRPEDHELIQHNHIDQQETDHHATHRLINSILDENVKEAFSGLRSVGIIKGMIKDIYKKRSTGGRAFTRLVFSDHNHEYDWIVPEIRFNTFIKDYLDEDQINFLNKASVIEKLNQFELFVTVGLTKPNNRFPGQFRGCHPLVVGLHSFPSFYPN